jgi:hypothetical protein
MFPRSYFTGAYFAPTYWPPVDGTPPPVVIPPSPRQMIARVGRMMGG